MNPDPPRTTRRAWLGLWAGVAAAAGVCAHAFAWARSLVPNVRQEPPTRRRIGPPARYPDGVTFLQEARIFVVRQDRAVRALSAVCSHLGCTVARQGEGYHCPCHGSRFDSDGAPTAGPAPGPLAWHPVSQAGDGSLVVDLGARTSAESRLVLPADGGEGGR